MIPTVSLNCEIYCVTVVSHESLSESGDWLGLLGQSQNQGLALQECCIIVRLLHSEYKLVN